jgi:Dolichyl-phosphate-mannose-protein mannosyltransferase
MTASTANSGQANHASAWKRIRWSGDLAILIYIALATVAVHVFAGGRYGFHRDELATLDDARHLAWGYVAYPPIAPFFGRISLILFGTSLAGFRFFAALADAAAVVLTGLMARDFGGRRGAQMVAAVATIPFCLAAGSLMQYVSFDYFFWVLTAYFVIRLLKSNNPRWWLAIGCAIGLGMMSKYAMPFLVAGLLMGVLLSSNRRYLASKWLWYGVAVSLLIFLPNLLWQIRHDFISIQFLRSIHARDIRIGRTKGFLLPGQIQLTLLAAPLWIAGLFACLFSRTWKTFRVVGWMYLTPLLLFVILKGRNYYMAGAYPMLYAAGSVWGEKLPMSFRHGRATTVRVVSWTALLLDVAVVINLTLPIAPIGSKWWNGQLRMDGDLREEFGWHELVETVASIRHSLPAQDRAHLGILAGNYGEAGAIDLYGPRYGLPPAISGVNSYWARGYGNPAPETLIVIGLPLSFLQNHFASCRLAGHTWNRYGVKNEETLDHPDIFVCRGLTESWPTFWSGFQYYN